jgi:hypothetical protein
MELQAGYRFRAAPHFHLDLHWSDRIRLSGGGSAPPGWRPATDAELALLVEDPVAGAPATQSSQLFTIPAHLRSQWWVVADGLTDTPMGDSPAYQGFVRAVASFLAFKGLPLPGRCAFDVVLSPGKARTFSPGLDAGGAGQTAPLSSTVACVNLGDGPVSLVFLNLPADRLRAILEAGPDYPRVRLFLEPGEGVWLPPG